MKKAEDLQVCFEWNLFPVSHFRQKDTPVGCVWANEFNSCCYSNSFESYSLSFYFIPVSAQVKNEKKNKNKNVRWIDSFAHNFLLRLISLKCIGAGAGGVSLCRNVVKSDDSFFFWPIYCTPVAHILAVGFMINRIPPISPFCVRRDNGRTHDPPSSSSSSLEKGKRNFNFTCAVDTSNIIWWLDERVVHFRVRFCSFFLKFPLNWKKKRRKKPVRRDISRIVSALVCFHCESLFSHEVSTNCLFFDWCKSYHEESYWRQWPHPLTLITSSSPISRKFCWCH